MKSTQRVLNPIQTANSPIERFSFRIQDDVEIYEHEVQQTFDLPKQRSAVELGPRLIVAELARAGVPMLTKTRAEVGGLNSLLRTIMGISQPIS